MSAYISIFKINQEGTELDVILSANPGDTIQSITLWTQDTFKDYSKGIDFTGKLSQLTNAEAFTITASEISESGPLTNIYFLEVTDTSSPEECAECNNTILGVTTDFSRFTYCIIEYLYKMKSCCGECNQELGKALTMNLYIDNLKNSLQLGNFTTAIKFWKNLNRACKTECQECNDFKGIVKKGLGFQTLGNQLTLY